MFRSDAVEQLFSDRARLQGILDFEATLARAEETLIDRLLAARGLLRPKAAGEGE